MTEQVNQQHHHDLPPPLESPNSPNPGATGLHSHSTPQPQPIGDLTTSPVIPSSATAEVEGDSVESSIEKKAAVEGLGVSEMGEGEGDKTTATPATTATAATSTDKDKEKATTPAKTAPTTTKSAAPKEKPKSSSWLSCFSCFSSSSFDEKPSPSSSSPSKPSPVTPPPTAPLSEKSAPVPSPSPAPSPSSDTPAPTQIPRLTPTTTPTTGVTLPVEETEGVTSGAVQPPGSGTPLKKRRKSGKNNDQSIITSVPEPGMPVRRPVEESGSEEDSEEEDEDESDEEDEEQNLIARGGVGIPIGEDGLPQPLLAELAPELKGRKCLVLDLDETLVHSSFKQMVHQADYVVPVEIENQYHNVYVIKRPGVDGFLKAMGEIYEIVIFTASLSKYADPVLDQLDIHQVVKHRLFRESCYNNKGNYVKDLSQLGRPMEECIIIDNSPASYVFHPNNAVPISSWFNDPHDTELTDLVPFLTDLEKVDDIRAVLDAGLYQHLA